MSYASYRRLPGLSTYDEAKDWLDRVKPLRGSDPVVYPLGDRKAGRRFSFRYADDEASNPKTLRDSYQRCPDARECDIELLLYHHPVVTFHADNTVTISDGGYDRWSTSDYYFITEVLCRYFNYARTDRGRLVLEHVSGADADGKSKITVIERGQYATFALDPGKREATRINADANKVIRMNRAKANIVRSRYGQFYRYMKGMIGLRREHFDAVASNPYRYHTGQQLKQKYIVRFGFEEINNVLPADYFGEPDAYKRRHMNDKKYVNLRVKPAISQPYAIYDHEARKWDRGNSAEPYVKWKQQVSEFIDLIATPDDHPEQHARFYKAFMYLVIAVRISEFSHYYQPQTEQFTVDPAEISRVADEVVFKFFSEEVFEVVDAKPNSVPSVRYATWVTRERG